MIRLKWRYVVFGTMLLSVAMVNWIGRLLCRLGFHDYQLIEVTGTFGGRGQVEKVECRRCRYATTRSG